MNLNKLFFGAILLLVFGCNYSTETYKEGKILFTTQCAGCHGDQFEGLGNLYPSLKDAAYIQSQRTHLACWIHQGIGTPGGQFNLRHSDLPMPPIPKLSAVELTNILNYLNSQIWKMNAFTIQEIETQLKTCPEIRKIQ